MQHAPQWAFQQGGAEGGAHTEGFNDADVEDLGFRTALEVGCFRPKAR